MRCHSISRTLNHAWMDGFLEGYKVGQLTIQELSIFELYIEHPRFIDSSFYQMIGPLQCLNLTNPGSS